MNFVLHRDIGFLCVGLTMLYGISGLVVNHISHDFNPSYKIERLEAKVEPIPDGTPLDMASINKILDQLKETGTYKNVVMLSPTKMRIFVENNTIDVWPGTGKVFQEKLKRRPLLFEANFLHLNKPKGVWTFLADGYAILLMLLAVTGFLMIKSKTLTRGLLLMAIGFFVPVAVLIFSLY